VPPLIASPSQVFNEPVGLGFNFASVKFKRGWPKVERRLAAWALYFPEAGVLDSAYGFYFHVRRYSKKIHCFCPP